ncbi:MAG: carbon-nitrogen hydrolase [Pseudomonadales bacterium]|nr:carbon-nitrogen hydrolase [Pseudomonadales bacterium]
MKVGVVQQTCWEDKQKSLAESERLINELAEQGVELILLQELHATQYFCQTEDLQYFDLAEPLQGPTTQKLSELAKKHQCVIVGSIFEKRMAGVFHNTAVVLEKDGSLAGCYRKMHIPDDPGFYEKFYFTPGDAQRTDLKNQNAFQPIKTSVGNLGVLVCWDQWYPEAARLMALAGADILLYPTAIGWDQDDTIDEQQRQLNAWTTIQKSHAVANHLPVLVANRIGHENDPSGQTKGSLFWGNSFICGPQGEILANANDKECVALVAEIEYQRTEYLRQIWPFLRDRRIDAYSPIVNRVNLRNNNEE